MPNLAASTVKSVIVILLLLIIWAPEFSVSDNNDELQDASMTSFYKMMDQLHKAAKRMQTTRPNPHQQPPSSPSLIAKDGLQDAPMISFNKMKDQLHEGARRNLIMRPTRKPVANPAPHPFRIRAPIAEAMVVDVRG